MNILIVSQCFWPDTVSVAQHLGELCIELTKKGHNVKIITSRFSYEDKSIIYPKIETYYGIQIKRLNHTSFGKKNLIGRAIDFISFNISTLIPLLKVNPAKINVIIAMPPPPLLPFICSLIAKLKGIPHLYWAMDLQPELSYATGILKKKSIAGKILNKLTYYTIQNSEIIVSLDNDMKNYLNKKGGVNKNIIVSPVWPVMENYYNGNRLSNPFRIANRFGNKLVIMYSGNYGDAHPVDTLLEAAYKLRKNNSILIVFIGGGTQYLKVKRYRTELGCSNIIQLPYQPKENIHISLAAADFHVVVLNKRTIGFTHPNKIYGAMYVGRPIIFIGSENSFIGEILKDNQGNLSFSEEQSSELADAINESSNNLDQFLKVGQKNRDYVQKHFNPSILKSKMVEIITTINH